MASYLLLLHSGYAPASQAVAMSAASGQLVLGPNNVDPRVLASGNASSGPFQWHWSIVRKDDLGPDAKANKSLLVFPFLRSTSDRGGGKPIAVPFRKLKQLPEWATPYTLDTLSNSTGLARIQSLSDPASAEVDGLISQSQTGPEYSLYLSFHNDGQHTGWKMGTKLGDYPELLVADNFTSEQSEFLMFVGRNQTDLYDYNTSQWPTTKQGGDTMPWASIFVMLVSFFLTKKKTGSSTKAALVAGLAGAGTYYVQQETDWGRANLNALDGDADYTETKPVLDADGQPVQNPDGSGPLTTVVRGATDVLKSWGGTGTAAVVGTAAVASSSSLQKYIPWAIAAAIAVMVLK